MTLGTQPELLGTLPPGATALAGLPRKQKEWAAFYNIGERTLKNWMARGREEDDACPYTEPSDLIVWISRHIKRDSNLPLLEKINAGARRLAELRAKSVSAPAASAAPPAVTTSAAPSDAALVPSDAAPDALLAGLHPFAPDKNRGIPAEKIAHGTTSSNFKKTPAAEMSFSGLLSAARQRSASLLERLREEELKTTLDEALLSLLERQFTAACKTQKDLELRANEILEQSGLYGLVSDMVAEVARIHAVIVPAFFGLRERYEARAGGEFDAMKKTIWREEFAKVLEQLHGNQFAAGLVLPPDPPAPAAQQAA